MLQRWRWSIAKAFGRVTVTVLRLASPSRVRRSNCSLGFWAAAGLAADLANRHLRLEPEVRAVDRVEVGGEIGARPLVADPLRGDAHVGAIRRVDHEVRPVDVDLDRPHPQRDAADDQRQRVGDGADVGVERVDVNRDPHHLGPVVVGPGDRGSDHGKAQRRALERPGEVDPADDVERMAAGAGGHVRGADQARAAAARIDLLGPAELRRGLPDRVLRAVVDPPQRAGQPRRHREVEVPEELVAVVTVELQGEGAEVAGQRIRRAGDEARRERPDLSGAGPAVRALR